MAARLQADEEQLACLIRREGEAQVLLGEPSRELARRQQFKLGGGIRRRLRHCPIASFTD